MIGTCSALAQSMTKCSSDTFAERTDPGQHTSAVEIAQPAPVWGGLCSPRRECGARGRSTHHVHHDDGVMTLGFSEKATVERESGSTLRPCAWYLDEIDDTTLAKVADLVRTAFRVG